MHRSYDYHQNHNYGWNTTSQEYVEHIARMERMPTMVTDVPRFPSLFNAFNGQVHDNKDICKDDLPLLNHHNQQMVPEARKKVHFVEQERKATAVNEKEKGEVRKEFDVNIAADGFINQKRKNFALYK